MNNDLKKWSESELDKWVRSNVEASCDEAEVEEERKDINIRKYEILYNFILQLLEDHGFMFYESNVEMDEMS